MAGVGERPVPPAEDAPTAARSKSPGRHRVVRRIPLSLLVARYFLYVLVGVLLVAGFPLLAFEHALSSGTVFPANYGETNAGSLSKSLATQGSFDAGEIPSAFWYAHLSADGEVLQTDMDASLLATARQVASSGASGAEPSGATLVRVRLSDGSTCVLAYRIMPQWSDRVRRDVWPNPQNLLVAAVVGGTVAVVLFVALRAGRVLTREMRPLVDAADAVARQDLDFQVGRSRVAQVDDVLLSMDRMRSSLRESLQAQWETERRSREQVAALAHDLKTPLTVVRGNADLLLESDLGDEERECALAIRDAAESQDACIRQIILASRGEGVAAERQDVDLGLLFESIANDAARIAHASGIELRVGKDAGETGKSSPLEGRVGRLDADLVSRAVLNLVGNACDHARSWARLCVAVTDGGDGRPAIEVMVEDDGAGFSPRAIKHGAERFYRGDASRGGVADGAMGSHYGLGLSVAQQAAQAHGGELVLGNRTDADGVVLGARVTLSLRV